MKLISRKQNLNSCHHDMKGMEYMKVKKTKYPKWVNLQILEFSI